MLVLLADCTPQVDKPAKLVEASKLSKTDVVATLETPLGKGRNAVYCASFVIAWNKLKAVLGENVLTKPKMILIERLNNSKTSKNVIDDEYLIAWAGVHGGGIEEIAQQLHEKPPSKEMNMPFSVEYNRLTAYAYLSKTLSFKEDFEEVDDELKMNGKSLKAFGFSTYTYEKKRLLANVEILYYKNDDSFVIRLNSKNSGDYIIMAKTNPKTTLLQTIAATKKLIKQGKKRKLKNLQDYEFIPDDKLLIPQINFNIQKDFSDLAGIKLLNPKLKAYTFEAARQTTQFMLNKSGAKIESTAEVYALTEAEMDVPKNKYLVFDKPFLLYIEQQNSTHPYFALWIDNAELLIEK